ncbi:MULTISPECIES: hypothetical protein [unclassified Actinomyces]|nr:MULTISPECIES: hypothetical protein [unclassified Actinomyces]MBW3068308.1 hypothetical protein [Actinomyces sp. 594]NDR53682.1 hypothetical protein [Actinomyces sp. 565]
MSSLLAHRDIWSPALTRRVEAAAPGVVQARRALAVGARAVDAGMMGG